MSLVLITLHTDLKQDECCDLTWYVHLVINKILSYFQGMFFEVLKEFHCNLISIFQPAFLVQLILIISCFHICTFACVLTFICTPQPILAELLVICRSAQGMKILVTDMLFPGKIKQDSVLPSCLSSHTVNKYHFCHLFSVTFVTGLVVISLFKMAPCIVLKCCLV